MNLKLIAGLIAWALPLAGCGNKGPLVQAERPAPAGDVVAPPPAAPSPPAPPTPPAADDGNG
jgi:hypothetical protein